MTDNNSIERVDSKHYSEVADILTSAFYDDPVFTWFMRKDSKKENAFKSLFTTVLAKYYLPSIVYKDTGSNSCSIWVDSKDVLTSSELSIPMKIRFLINVTNWCTLGGVNRFMHLTGLQDDAHPPEPHHYLWAVGVKPEAQGKGLGTKMLSYHLANLDELQIPAYLENSKEANFRFYERLGFKQINNIELAEGGPYLWGMWRDPK